MALEERKVRLLPERQDHRVSLELLDLASGLWEPCSSSSHLLDREDARPRSD